MDANLGDANSKYNMVMEFVPVRDFGAATIYCENGTNYSQIGYGVNRINPTWIYLVYKLYVYPDNTWNYFPYREIKSVTLSWKWIPPLPAVAAIHTRSPINWRGSSTINETWSVRAHNGFVATLPLIKINGSLSNLRHTAISSTLFEKNDLES